MHFYATLTDQEHLLDYLGEPAQVTLRPWPVLASPPVTLSRDVARATERVMIVSHALGPPVPIRAGDPPMEEPSRSGVFNRLNWERLKPRANERLVDSNASPVLLWTPATHNADGLGSGSIGSQADSMKAISDDYERWVNRVMNWVRRRGTPVWGLKAEATRPDLDVRRTDVTTLHALPDALAKLEAGTPGH
ncbi:hypothetical protein [Aeromicrobium terrae]|uniref:Uncharacterized protein n=1 Tax=Aeromicrobium terrae TaxID=2498846 RepID=A0A5C8NM56_9ACTN|nr:hypothetical protein [Aeromicrobium terrae]TXL61553.1 hypothetical protein FHP06_09035 [Aeromicrobium terrae]